VPLAPFGSRPAHVVEFGPVSVEHRVPQILKSGDSCSRQMPEGRDERKHGNVLPTPLLYSCALAQFVRFGAAQCAGAADLLTGPLMCSTTHINSRRMHAHSHKRGIKVAKIDRTGNRLITAHSGSARIASIPLCCIGDITRPGGPKHD